MMNILNNAESIVKKYWFVIIILLCIPSFYVILRPGFFGISDDVHVAWLFEMDKVIRLGQIPPRFVPDLSYGFGYPLFNFVFPLPFYIAEIFHLMGASLVSSIKAVFLISTFLSGFAMFLLLRKLTNVYTSLLGSILYVYTPYRATDLYIRGAIGEIVAFIFLPLILYATLMIITENKNSFKNILIGGLCLGGLFLSHNITVYMFMPFLVLFALLLSLTDLKNITKKLAYFFAMVVVGLLISIYFWLPALLESNLMKYDTVFNFVDHFPTLRQLFTPYWGYGASVPGPYDGLSFFQGVINIAVIIFGLLGLIIFWKKISPVPKAILLWVYISYFSALFLMNFRSTLIWEHMPLLNYFQFPWRFLIMVTLITPIALIILDQFKFKKELGILLSGMLTVVIIVISTPMFRPQEFLLRDDKYFLDRYIPTPEVQKAYLEHQEEYLRLPKNTQKRPEKLYPPAFLQEDEKMQINTKQINALYSLIYVDATSNAKLSLNKYYFPGWNVKIDGIKSEIEPGTPFGQVTINIKNGAHTIEAYFIETPFRMVLNIVSLLTLLITLTLIFRRPRFFK